MRENGFDGFAEEACREFYAGNRGRPGVAPGVYFRMLMVGYLEGIGSERGIAWRCADSFSLREFLGYGLAENPPEHSTLSKTRMWTPPWLASLTSYVDAPLVGKPDVELRAVAYRSGTVVCAAS